MWEHGNIVIIHSESFSPFFLKNVPLLFIQIPQVTLSWYIYTRYIFLFYVRVIDSSLSSPTHRRRKIFIASCLSSLEAESGERRVS